MSRKKKKSLSPRRKRMNQPRRLQAARDWLPKYNGKNIVRGYSKHFGVDWLCALAELKMLGIEIDPEYEAHLRQAVENRIKENQRRKERKEQEERERRELEFYQESDERFAYIAGYTSGGVPFGVSWEEMERMDEIF